MLKDNRHNIKHGALQFSVASVIALLVAPAPAATLVFSSDEALRRAVLGTLPDTFHYNGGEHSRTGA